MNQAETTVITQQNPTWLGKLRLLVAVGLVWAELHYLADATVLIRGLDRPPVVFAGDGGVVAGVVVLVLLVAGALVGMLLTARREAAQALIVVGLGLALWAWSGGTADDWLELRNPTIGPATAAAYWPLLAEYVYWAAVVTVVLVLGGWLGRRLASGTSPASWRSALGFDPSPAGLRDGITALIVTVAVAATLVLILTGPRVGHTYRGQVYFAVALGFIVAVLVARRVSGARGIIWFVPAPLIVGVVGVLLAVWKPGLGAGYENINVIPAWGLVRPLPVEMVAIGLVATLLTLRAATRLSSEQR